MNSLVTGAEEKSGFRRTQLQHVSQGLRLDDAKHRLEEVSQTDSPFLQETRAELIFQKSAEEEGKTTGPDSHIRLLGGSGGIAAFEWGNVKRSFVRRSSNSEYLLALSMGMRAGSCVKRGPFSNYH